ncbi:alkaline phosphatase family protein [Micrococcus luteus]
MSAPVPSGAVPAERHLRSVMTSAAAALGVPDMDNALAWPQTRRAVVAMVDGLGRNVLRRFGGHAPFLKSAMESHGRVLQAPVPTTTAASLTSLGTGHEPGVHGVVGYDVLDPDRDVVVNMLGGWDPATVPEQWQPLPTVLERAEAAGCEVATVSLPLFAGSALTRASLRGGEYRAGSTMAARMQLALGVLEKARQPALVYLYFNELDKAGHRDGLGADSWLHALEEVDATLRRLHERMPAGSTLGITGDHGMVDVPPARRLDYAALNEAGELLHPALLDGVAHTAGEPRLVQLHFRAGVSAERRAAVAEAWRAAHGANTWVLTRDEAIEAGWFGAEVTARVRPRIGDLLIAAHGDLALYDGRRVSPHAFDMVGQHGSPTRAEREVPLLLLTA